MTKPKLPDHAEQWNILAEKHDLPRAGGFRTKERAEQIDHYHTCTEDFWRDLDVALGRRGAWARGKRFPNFEQLMDESIVAKLMEGYYEDEENPQAEHEALVAGLVRRHSGTRLDSGAVICAEGLEAARGLERWSEISWERLRDLQEWLEGP